MTRRIPLALVALLALVLVAGCGGGGSDTESGEPAAAPGEDAVSVETQLEEQYGETEWFAAVSHISSVMKLRHPVWEIHFGTTVAELRENGWDSEAQWAFGDLGLDGYWVEVYGTDGQAGAGGSGGGESVTLPAAPDSVDGMAGWMDAAYGPGSGDPVEEWYGHITGYAFETDAWDGAAVLVVKTDLADVGFEWSPEREIVDLVRHAAASANVAWATNLRVEDADAQNLSTGEYRPDMVPYQGY